MKMPFPDSFPFNDRSLNLISSLMMLANMNADMSQKTEPKEVTPSENTG